MLAIVFLIAALLLFVVAAFNQAAVRPNLTALGLAFVVAALLVPMLGINGG